MKEKNVTDRLTFLAESFDVFDDSVEAVRKRKKN